MTRSLFVSLTLVAAAGAAVLAQSAAPARPAPSPAAQAPVTTAATPSSQAAQPTVEPAPGMPQVTFRVEVNYVDVDVVVTDREGRVVHGLTREDFEVFEDDRPQTVELFSKVEIPIERAERVLLDRPPIEPDVKVNRPFEGRMFVLVLDDMHTHPMRSLLVQQAAKRFVRQHVGANDLVAVVYTGGRTGAGQDFTSSKRLLSSAIERFIGQKTRSRTLNRLDEYNRQRAMGTPTTRAGVQDPDDQIRAYNVRMAMDTLRSVANYLQGVRGRRKAVLFFSEGIDYDITNPFENREATTVINYVQDAIGAATRSNVAFYTIDPRGLPALSDEGMEMGMPPEDPGLGISQTSLYDELRLSQDSLRTLAEETGGFAVVNTNDFAGSFDKLIQETSTYYVLGYYPTNQKRDGRFRDIDVRVKKPGLQVSARRGYQAPKDKAPVRRTEAAAGTSAALRDALNSPIPESALPMGVQVAAFKGTAPNASVAIITQFGGRAFKFTEEGGVFKNTLELSLLAIDPTGKIAHGDRNTAELKLSPQTHQAVLTGGFRLVSRIDLKPGRYTLRVAARESGGLIGSVPYELEVPDFSKNEMSISGLVLTAATAGMTPTGRNDEQLKQVLPGPPTVARDFVRDDMLAVFAEVYDNQPGKPHKVDIRTSVIGEDGRTVFTTEDERESSELKGAKGGYGYTAQIPLKDIAAGAYVLRVEARSRLEVDKPVVRETEFRVIETPRPAPAASAPTQVRAIVPVDRGPMSGIDAYREVVARTPEEWTALWGTLPARRPMPKVTFANTMIAALFVGERPSTGYSVEFTGVRVDGDTMVIEYVEKAPGPDVAAGQMITTPYFVAGVPLHAGPVRFVKATPVVKP
jgi:VWFA-related protein